MQKIKINLSSGRYRKSASMDILAFSLLFASLIYSWHSLDVFMKNRASMELYREGVAVLEDKLKAYGIEEAREKNLKPIERDAEIINTFAQRRAFSWTGLLDSLEECVPPGVSLIQISPEFNSGMVRVTGLGRSMDDILTLVQALAGSPRFGEAYLLKHSERNSPAGAGIGVILFEASAKYKEGGS